MMRPTHSRSFGLIVYHQFFSKKYFLENPIWRIVVFLLANFTCQLKAPGRGQGCLCGLFDSPCCWEGGGGRRVGLTKELNREKNWKLKCSELKRRRLGKGSCAEKEALSVLGIRRRWRSPQIHRRCSPEIHWRCSPQIRWRAPGQYWAPGVGTGLNGLVTTELEGIVTVHCDENQSPEILRDQMISVVATIIWIVSSFKQQLHREAQANCLWQSLWPKSSKPPPSPLPKSAASPLPCLSPPPWWGEETSERRQFYGWGRQGGHLPTKALIQ